MHSRRDFLRQLGGATALLPLARAARLVSAPTIKVGCAAITWNGDDAEAITDIGDLGFPGIQLRANAVRQYGSNPAALRDLLAAHRLAFVALSSGDVPIDVATESQTIELHATNARFLRDAGGLYLQLIDQRPRGRDVTRDDYKRLGHVLTEIGRRAADTGVTAAYHHHMGSLGEKPDEIDRVLEASDPRYVRLLLDVAHYQAGGGDPVAAIRRYRDRILFLHIKDLRRPVRPDGPAFQFVELGRGVVDLKGVFGALDDIGFHGWAVVELDRVPDSSRTPKEANAISKHYLEDTIGLRIA